ncbi:hypothetical protein MIDIC_240052 [Alphaproteobacteria bacterium]
MNELSKFKHAQLLRIYLVNSSNSKDCTTPDLGPHKMLVANL